METEGCKQELIEESIESQDENRIFELVMMTGEILLQNGAEIFRVQETMIHVAKAYGVETIDIFAISNGIFMTINFKGRERVAQIKYIPIAPIHLGRITAVNNLSRDIVLGKYSVDNAIEEIERISSIPYATNTMRILFAGVGSASFCYILGGSIWDSCAAFIAGIILYVFLIYTERAMTPTVLNNVFGSAIVTLISLILFRLGLGDSFDHIMIGAIICLVPGVSFTTSVRDFFNEDYLSGTIHLVNALLVATSIAVGVGVIMSTWNLLFG